MAREILIADSDKADQEELQKIFETTDYHLVFSESGEDVLLRVKLFKPDLIIAGTALSEKNGFELCEAIKGDPEFKHIPFILLLNVSEEIPEKERKRLRLNGTLSKPLHEGEVLNMVDRLFEGMRVRGEQASKRETKWNAFADVKREGFMADELAGKEDEEEIIDLLDVVEEAEPRMSINDFAIPQKEEGFGEIVPLESWDKLEGEQKLAGEEGFVLSLREEEEPAETPFRLSKEEPAEKAPSEELFEKIELEDILEKVERMEIHPEKGFPKKATGVLDERAPVTGELEEQPLGLDEFEALLQKGVEAKISKIESLEETPQPFAFEEPRPEDIGEVTAIEIPEEELKEWEGLAEEKFPKGLLEEALEEERIGAIEGLEEEELEELKEEDIEEMKIEEPEEKVLEEEELEDFEAEELEVIEEPRETEEIKEERIELFKDLEAPEGPRKVMRMVGEPHPIGIERPAKTEAERFFEEAGVEPRRVDQQIDEVLSDRVRSMMEEFVTKHVPEMTRDLVGLTIERIEKLVREIVPDVAEKMIEEEIKRLEKGEKD